MVSATEIALHVLVKPLVRQFASGPPLLSDSWLATLLNLGVLVPSLFPE